MAKPRKPAKRKIRTRKIDGRKYKEWAVRFKTKRNAQPNAKAMRKRGASVRVVKVGGRYSLFIAGKRRK